MAPMLEPTLKTPNAKDRSRDGNHSEAAFADPGNTADAQAQRPPAVWQQLREQRVGQLPVVRPG